MILINKIILEFWAPLLEQIFKKSEFFLQKKFEKKIETF